MLVPCPVNSLEFVVVNDQNFREIECVGALLRVRAQGTGILIRSWTDISCGILDRARRGMAGIEPFGGMNMVDSLIALSSSSSEIDISRFRESYLSS